MKQEKCILDCIKFILRCIKLSLFFKASIIIKNFKWIFIKCVCIYEGAIQNLNRFAKAWKLGVDCIEIWVSFFYWSTRTKEQHMLVNNFFFWKIKLITLISIASKNALNSYILSLLSHKRKCIHKLLILLSSLDSKKN